uniref:Uncharacterized protein n=1 Tax=Phlebotomus papatasi TaxID=29031 RepID=A0A1B0DLD9_PHLPP
MGRCMGLWRNINWNPYNSNSSPLSSAFSEICAIGGTQCEQCS